MVIPFLFVAAVTSATPPQASPTATTANGRVSVFVSELHADEASALFSPALTDLLANEVARFQGVEVISAGDVKALLNAEATKQLLGCSDDDCFVDIARMLNTTYLLHGTVHRFEGSTQVTINVVDAEAGRSVSRAQQILGAGDPEDLLTALRACATNALHPIVGDALASDGFVITPALLRDLHTAARDKPFDVSVGGGVGIPFGSHPDVALDGPFFSGAAQGTYYPFKHVGFGLSARFDYQRSQTQGTLFFGDISGEGGFVNDDTTSEAEVLAGALMVQATVRAQEGVLLPYVRGGIGAGLLSIALGDVLPSRNDLPLFLARQREAGTSLAAVVEGTVGVELIAIDPLQLRAELTLFSYLNDLQARSFVGGQDKSDAAEITAVPVGPVGGVSLQLAIGFQG